MGLSPDYKLSVQGRKEYHLLGAELLMNGMCFVSAVDSWQATNLIKTLLHFSPSQSPGHPVQGVLEADGVTAKAFPCRLLAVPSNKRGSLTTSQHMKWDLQSFQNNGSKL